MFKIFSLALLLAGIFIGVTYSDEIKDIIEPDSFDILQDKVAEGVEMITDTIEEVKG